MTSWSPGARPSSRAPASSGSCSSRPAAVSGTCSKSSAGLDRELEALFKPSGSKPRINEVLASLKEARATVRDGSLPSSEWVEHDAAFRRASGSLEQLEARLEAARAEKRRLERIHDALPVLSRRRQAREELEAMGPVVLLPDDFTDRRHNASSALETARTAEAAALRAIAELDAPIDDLAVPDDLLAEAEAVERIRDGLAGYRKAVAALPEARGQLRIIEAEASEIAAELGALGSGSPSGERPEDPATGDGPSSSARAMAIKPTRTLRTTTTRLNGELVELTLKQEQADARVGELTDRLESERAELARLAEPGDAEPLSAALRQARDQGDLDAQVEAARARLDRAEIDAAQAMALLPLWSGPREASEVAARPVPAVESVNRCESELSACESELERLRSARADADAEADQAAAHLAALRESAGVLPTEDDLARARDGRDRAWRLIRRTIEPGGPSPSADEIRAAFDDPRPDPATDVPAAPAGLATAYERAVERADVCADRLRGEADRVAAQVAARASVEPAAAAARAARRPGSARLGAGRRGAVAMAGAVGSDGHRAAVAPRDARLAPGAAGRRPGGRRGPVAAGRARCAAVADRVASRGDRPRDGRAGRGRGGGPRPARAGRRRTARRRPAGPAARPRRGAGRPDGEGRLASRRAGPVDRRSSAVSSRRRRRRPGPPRTGCARDEPPGPAPSPRWACRPRHRRFRPTRCSSRPRPWPPGPRRRARSAPGSTRSSARPASSPTR